jgi:hypothetical protein
MLASASSPASLPMRRTTQPLSPSSDVPTFTLQTASRTAVTASATTMGANASAWLLTLSTLWTCLRQPRLRLLFRCGERRRSGKIEGTRRLQPWVRMQARDHVRVRFFSFHSLRFSRTCVVLQRKSRDVGRWRQRTIRRARRCATACRQSCPASRAMSEYVSSLFIPFDFPGPASFAASEEKPETRLTQAW